MHTQVCRPVMVVCLVVLATRSAHAAGGPYVVDDAAIVKPGECQVESWASYASNSHFIGTTQPACTVRLGIPVELTAVFAATRSDAWNGFTGVQAKMVPVDRGGVAIAVSAGRLFDVTDGEKSFSFVTVPVTLKVHDQFRINLNAGGLWAERDHFTWGIHPSNGT